MMFKEPGRFGHVIVKGICECPRTTIDSDHIVMEPVSISCDKNGVGTGLWAMFYCHNCGGTGAIRVSCVQNALETYHHKHAKEAMRIWMNPPEEPKSRK